jgi:2,4-dienoyl-CoA reductase (NADPH2)
LFVAALRPGRIGTLALPNRIVMGSMHLGIEASGDGERLAAFYVERVRGGAGMIVTGGVAVNRVGAGGLSYALVNENGQTAALERVARAVHAAGGRIAMQLLHAGRYAFEASYGLQPLAPSAVPSSYSRSTPRAMNEDEILSTIGDFARGAARAKELGYDAVEVMGSEGYLLNQFLSPLTNLRDDAWGGDADRRMRFGLEVLHAVRAAVGAEFPVIFRISGADLMDGSTSQEDTLRYSTRLAENGVDALNVGVGWHESATPTVQGAVPAGAWIPYAAAVKRAAGTLPVIASNRVTTLELADRILAAGEVDFISMARPFLADPAIVAKSTAGESIVNVCIACNQACIDRSLTDEEVSCMVNPHAVHERELAPLRRRGASRHFAVVGGGPAGLEAARVLGTLGHRVTLYEAEQELGGQFRLARRIPGKEDFARTILYFAAELRRLGVRVELGRNLGANDVEELRAYDGVVLAAGVLPRTIEVPGADLPHVVSYARLLGGVAWGKRVAVIGAGGVGVDVARLVCDDARTTLLRRGKRIGERIGRSTRWVVLKELRERGVETLTGVRYERITPEGLHVSDSSGEARFVPADTIVVAAGQEPNAPLASELERAAIPHRIVGGALRAVELDAVRAFAEGMRAAYALGAA